MPENYKADDTLPHEISSRAAVPSDFPRYPLPTKPAGTQMLSPARLIDGKYVVRLTPLEQFEHHYVYLDFMNQLIAYAHGKRDQRPEVPLVEIVDEIVYHMSLQGWNLSKLGQELVTQQLIKSFE